MLLLIPGPVTTRPEVRAAMAQDIAPWDNDFRPLYAEVRERVPRWPAHAPRPTRRCRCRAAAISPSKRRSAPSAAGRADPDPDRSAAYADRMTRLAREAGRVVVRAAGLRR